ncbi:MAG: hypothetical protein CFE24_09695 [Flavobacterium sp. BFFFF2]|nr:MAG: hypothetical protein CFE24_09695 [Flavobacterium sp. BFFFF2]
MIKLIWLFLLFFNSALFSQEHLRVNRQAPKINITDWIANIPADKNLENKYIVLEFWATWCKVCLESLIHLNNIQEKFNLKNLYFISITDEKVHDVKRILKKVNFKSIVVSDQKKLTQIAFGNKSGNMQLPITILIDNNGVLKWVGVPSLLTEQIIQDLVANKLAPYSMYDKHN